MCSEGYAWWKASLSGSKSGWIARGQSAALFHRAAQLTDWTEQTPWSKLTSYEVRPSPSSEPWAGHMSPTRNWAPLIPQILANRGWQLVNPGSRQWQSFVNDVAELLGQPEHTQISDEQAVYRAILTPASRNSTKRAPGRILNNSASTYEELWHWIYPRVYRRIDNPQDAEDVAQQVMLKVYQNLHQVKDPRGFLGWVSVITFHEIGEYFRQKERENQFMRGIAT